MEPTDEMVRTFLGALFRTGWADTRGKSVGLNIGLEMLDTGWEDRVRSALTETLAVMPVTTPAAIGYECGFNQGWIAGRDAARNAAMQAGYRRGDIGTLDAALHAISNMEPPQ